MFTAHINEQVHFVHKPPLGKERELELILLSQAGCKESTNLLIEHNLGFLWQMTGRISYDPLKMERGDLFQQAVVYFMSIIKKFEPARNRRLLTFAGTVIPMKLWRYVEECGVIRVPRNGNTQVREATKRAAECARKRLYDLPFGYDKEEGLEQKFYDDAEPHAIAVLRRRLSDLPERSQWIVQQRAKGRTLRDIATELKLSKERIRAIESRAVSKLQENRNEYAD